MEDNRKKGSADTQYDEGGPNHIKLAYNKCGAIYALKVRTHAKQGAGGGRMAARGSGEEGAQ